MSEEGRGVQLLRSFLATRTASLQGSLEDPPTPAFVLTAEGAFSGQAVSLGNSSVIRPFSRQAPV